MSQRIPQQQSGQGVLMGGGDNSGFAYVSGEQLRQVDTPIESLLGAASGAFVGSIGSSVLSAVVTMIDDGKNIESIAKNASAGSIINEAPSALRNITGKHLPYVLAGATAMAGLGAAVRYSRASKHNEWSNRHYSFLENKEQPAMDTSNGSDSKGYGDKIEAERKQGEEPTIPQR